MTDTDPCAREITWGGTKYPLNLNHPWVRRVLSIRGLPGRNGNSPAACIARFGDGSSSIEDVERVLELGLIGAGMPEQEAERLLDAHVRGKPLADNTGHAGGLLYALYMGNPQ